MDIETEDNGRGMEDNGRGMEDNGKGIDLAAIQLTPIGKTVLRRKDGMRQRLALVSDDSQAVIPATYLKTPTNLRKSAYTVLLQ